MSPGRPLVMGVVNLTPDSFSEGGRFTDPQAAVAHALKLVEEGADLLDIGGESTRPGAAAVDEAEELRRTIPVIEAIRRRSDIPIAIDTMKPAVARAACAAGASIWNDVSALRPEGSLEAAAELGCEVILMHMRGEPRTMQEDPQYDDVTAEVCGFLIERADQAMAAGVPHEAIRLDPGIGFGKTLEHNLALLANLDRLVGLGFPVVLGVSRKRFIRAIDPAAKDPGERLPGSLAAALAGAAAGADMLRVHDVRETVQALKVWRAIGGAASPLP